MKEIGEGLGISKNRASQLLSKAEKEVAKLLQKGLTHKEIATTLFVSEKTSKFHATNIYQKLGVRGKAELIVEYGSGIQEEPKMSESENWGPLPARQLQPLSKLPPVTGQDNVNFVVETFGINETIKNLQTMSTEVTKGDYSVEKVMAACQCIGRMNETIQTVMKAAQALNGR